MSVDASEASASRVGEGPCAGDAQEPLVRFRQLFRDAPSPRRADSGLSGTATIRAVRFCEPFTTASSFGWYVFSPIDFSLLWDGDLVYWKVGLGDDWQELEAVLLPGFSRDYAQNAPASLRAMGAPPFLGRGPEPGIVQVWTGLLARTRPGWCSLVRPLANHPRDPRYDVLDGLLETDWWFGPLVTPLRLRKTDEAIRFRSSVPLYQIQPVPREAYQEQALDSLEVEKGLDALDGADWEALEAALRLRHAGAEEIGAYKREVRRRARVRRAGA